MTVPTCNQIITCTAYRGGVHEADLAIDDISETAGRDGRFVWVEMYEPTSELLAQMRSEFDLHELATEDALRAHQRPKLEEYDGSMFVVLRNAALADGGLALGETHLFVGPHYIVVVRHGAAPPHPEVRARCEAAPRQLANGPGFVLYAVMDQVVDEFFPVVESLEDRLESIEEEVFTVQGRSTHELAGKIYALKRDLVAARRAVAPLVEVCSRLVRFDAALITEETRPYLRDVYDHVVRIHESLEQLRELLATVIDANLSLVTVRQNEVTKRLASWAAIIAVPTMIAGIYGMNFEYMPELRARLGYPLVMAGMAALCTLLYWRLRKAGWL